MGRKGPLGFSSSSHIGTAKNSDYTSTERRLRDGMIAKTPQGTVVPT
jgi:hypothetical protein